MNLNLGCGNQIIEGWINVDYGVGARFAKIPLFRSINKRIKFFNVDWDERIFLHDLTKQFPWPDNSVDMIYSSHTLEHLTRAEGRQLLKECFRVLRPGGIIRIVVPSLAWHHKQYMDGETPADEFVDNLGVLYRQQNGFFRNLMVPLISFPHKCMYDTPTLLRVFEEIGYEAEERKPFDSAIENIDTFESGHRTTNAVIVEGTKP